MFVIADDRIDRIIGFRRTLLWGGASWFLLLSQLPKDARFGSFTAFMLIGLGIFAVALQKWRTDPGLWMLATLLIVTYGPICAYFEYLEIDSLLNPAPVGRVVQRGWQGICFAFDCALALLVIGRIVRFALSVAVRNWQLTHPPGSRNE